MGNQETPRVNLLVSVEEASLPRFSEVVDGMRDAGMDVERQMESLGIVTGSIPPGNVKILRHTAGVAYVEESRKVYAS